MMNLNLKIKSKNFVLILLMLFANNQNFMAQKHKKEENKEFLALKTGADQPEKYLPLLKGKSVGIVTNQTGLVTLDEKPQSIVDFLKEKGIHIAKVFAPEHGFRGTADAGEVVKNGVDTKTGIPIISLYGANKKPTPAQIQDLDVILFDIQDVGVRFYTYISTLTYVMEAAAENRIQVIVLDRPNPHDGYTDGPILRSQWKSFVGLHPVPVVYGLTIGEYGKMVNGERWLKNGIQANYTLIEMENYHKKKRYPLLEKPSPNLPNEQSINLYPSLCFFEGAQVSVGRGTDLPFQIYGSPWIHKGDYSFTPKPSFGAKDPFLNGQVCYGENLSDYKQDLRELNLEWVILAYHQHKNPRKPFFITDKKGRYWFDTLAGTDELRKQIIAGKSQEEIKKTWQKDLNDFEKIRQKYIVYQD